MNVLGVEGGKEQKRMQKALAGPGQGVSGLSLSSFLQGLWSLTLSGQVHMCEVALLRPTYISPQSLLAAP